jgi:hypothetical protein
MYAFCLTTVNNIIFTVVKQKAYMNSLKSEISYTPEDGHVGRNM